MRCVTGLRPRNRRSTAIRSRSAPMDSLLSVVALGHRVSTRNGTNSGGAYQWGARAAPRTRQRHDHVIAAAAERLRSIATYQTLDDPLYPSSFKIRAADSAVLRGEQAGEHAH